jgi:hypothetical protein
MRSIRCAHPSMMEISMRRVWSPGRICRATPGARTHSKGRYPAPQEGQGSGPESASFYGGVAEWFIATVFKTVGASSLGTPCPRGSESHHLHQNLSTRQFYHMPIEFLFLSQAGTAPGKITAIDTHGIWRDGQRLAPNQTERGPSDPAHSGRMRCAQRIRRSGR